MKAQHAVGWAYDQDVRPAGRKFVLVTLATLVDQEWSCYPGQEFLAAATGQSERAVRDHLAALEADGIIRRGKRYRRDGTRTSDRFWLRPAVTVGEGGEDVPELPAEPAGSPDGPPEPDRGASPPSATLDLAAEPAGSPPSTTGDSLPDYRRNPPRLAAKSAGDLPSGPVQKDLPPYPPDVGEAGGQADAERDEAGRAVAALPPRLAPTSPRQRVQLVEAALALVRAGWPCGTVVELATADLPPAVRSPAGFVLTRWRSAVSLPPPRPEPVVEPTPGGREWCGTCDGPDYRWRQDPATGRWERCPECGT